MKTQFFYNDVLKSGYSLTEFPNGLKVYIYEKNDFNSIYAVFGTKFGSIDSSFSVNNEEIIVPDGVAHFLEHKLFESEDGDAFSKYAKTGAYANAFTSFDRTCYLFSCTDRFEENLDILLNFVQSPYFTAKTVKKEQGIIGQEIKMYDDMPSWRVLFNMLENMYHNHPVKKDIAGTVESISEIDDNVLYKCYETFYNPSNMFICISGNVNTKRVLKIIEKSIKKTDRVDFERSVIKEPENVVQNYVEQHLEVSMPLFSFAFKENIANNGNSLKKSIIMNALIKLICDDSTSLYKRLNELKLINDEFDAEYFAGNNFASIMFGGESKDPKCVAEEILKEVEYIKINGINKELFEAIKRDMYGQALKRYNSVEAVGLMLVDSAVLGYNYMEELNIIKNLTEKDVFEYLAVFSKENSVLSVIK